MVKLDFRLKKQDREFLKIDWQLEAASCLASCRFTASMASPSLLAMWKRSSTLIANRDPDSLRVVIADLMGLHRGAGFCGF